MTSASQGSEGTVSGKARPRSGRTPGTSLVGGLAAGFFGALSVLWCFVPVSAQISDLDEYIEAAMEDWQVPGLAVALVRHDHVVFQRGYGVLEMGGTRPVDENTLFGIGSTTKAMTAAALGILVDEGLLHWDDPVIKHLPGFRLYDPWVTEQVTVRDLLAHRVGVGRMIGNRIQYMTREPRSELIYRMRYLAPERAFREAHVYQNVMYMVAGEIVAAVTGMSWDHFVTERIFGPLGMESTNTSVHAFRSGDAAAVPHFSANGELTIIPRRDIDNVGPAGSVNSSVAEMAQWMRLQLQRGSFEGRALFSEEVWREMHRAQIALPGGDPLAGLSSYGLGWRLSEYHGRLLSQHGGGIDGMTAALFLIPEEALGVVVLSNMLPHSLSTAVARVIVDRELGSPFRDWSAEFLEAARQTATRAEALREEAELSRAPNIGPSLPLERYVGSYEDPLYGQAEVTLAEGRLSLQFWRDEDAILELHHWHHDTFRAVWPNPFHGEKFIWFSLDRHGNPVELNVEWNLRPPPSGYVRVVQYRRRTRQ